MHHHQQPFSTELMAQKMNEFGAYCLEEHRFNEAIDAFIRGLHFSESIEMGYVCSCESCSLDSCLDYTEAFQKAQQSLTDDMQEKDSVCIESSDCFLYCNPIHIAPRSMIAGGHSMGMTLPLILTFNLGLAYHLAAIRGPEIDHIALRKVLQLYEVAYRWQIDEMKEHSRRSFGLPASGEKSQVSSLRFFMVIANNLGELHRVISNHDKHQKCLQHLLSTLMFVVECRDFTSVGMPSELEGFFQNTSRLILQEQAAAAA